jgi:hypothetical protein
MFRASPSAALAGPLITWACAGVATNASAVSGANLLQKAPGAQSFPIGSELGSPAQHALPHQNAACEALDREN